MSLNKKIDVIIEARMASTRLPGKILLEVLNKPLLQLMIERIKKIHKVNQIIVATTFNKNDDVIVDFCKKLDIDFFRGSEDDVLGRVLGAANSFKSDIIVEITSDNPLVDPNICNGLIDLYLKNRINADIVSHDIPLGLCNGKVFDIDLLKKISDLTSHPVDREHVVNYIFQNKTKFKILHYKPNEKIFRKDIRLTLDYKEDFIVIKKVFEHFYPQNKNFDSFDIINFLDINKNIKNINKDCLQATYSY